MNELEIIDVLTSILQELKSVNQSIQSLQLLKAPHQDPDHDHDLNQSDQSDQIRSDQISNKCSNMEKFIEFLDKFSIDYSNLDLFSKTRSIDYFFENIRKITSKKGYILTMLKDCEIKKSQPKIYHKKPEEEDTSRYILGLKPELVEEKSLLLDLETFNKIFPSLTATEQRMFSSFEKVMSTDMLRNIFTAKGVNAGLL